jgi:tRNA(Arg) A34 adenosine deaminase TadA
MQFDTITRPNTRTISMLERLAVDNPGVQGRFKIAAGVIYKRHLIATGVNSYKTHPLMMTKGYRPGQVFMHAEVDAIRNSLRLITPSQLNSCELYIVRVKRPYLGATTWVHGLAKPCPGCTRVIANFGIERVFWTQDAPKEVDFESQ